MDPFTLNEPYTLKGQSKYFLTKIDTSTWLLFKVIEAGILSAAKKYEMLLRVQRQIPHCEHPELN